MEDKGQATQLDVIDTAKTGQSSVSGANLSGSIILPKVQLAASVPKDPCTLPQDIGSCQNYALMWFFDKKESKCSRFWYGGCGGNENRFETRRECENLCQLKRPGPRRYLTRRRRMGLRKLSAGTKQESQKP
uniref:kunitz-type serine protease inhibitor BmKTT-2-like n=1 Tax=Monopterus albus TaxID=43700 RepID=UPI0009B31596|nr:kunitz-type serine protease inhibitor BmKTT-2-like [Monopterus albus]